MSYELAVGDAPLPASLTPEVPSVEAGAPVTPAAPAPELLQLAETFGEDFTGFSSVEDAQRAALMIAQDYAKAGGVARPAPYAPPQAPAPAPPVAEVDEDYGDLDPKVIARIKRLDADLKQTQATARQFQDRIAHDQGMLQQQQHQDILNRAISAIDALADPRYGVGGNRSFAQDMARENLLRTADKIVDGMRGRRSPPTIEKLISMAVLAESGKLPARPAAGGKGAPPAPIASGQNPQGAPQLPRRKTGGELDLYVGDKEFMDGARAIVNRGRQ